jgi:predicted transcriptional regulator
MKVRDVATRLDLKVLTEQEGLEQEVTGGYVSDLLSDVIAHSRAGDLWITLQTHRNIIAVATLKDLAAIILVNGRTPDADTLMKAREEKIVVLSSHLSAFEVAGQLYLMGVRGTG